MQLNEHCPRMRRRPIDLRNLSSYQLPVDLMEDLMQTGSQLLIQVNHDGTLNISLVEGTTSAILTRPLKPVLKNRPPIYLNFPQRDEEKRRQLFAKPRICDYLGNEKERLVEIAKSGDLRDKFRMRTLIDHVDDQIAKYLGCNLYSLKWEKRPRINLDQFYDLYDILPHKMLHLINILSFGSSLILHRRSQRVASMPLSTMSRLERLFYFCPYPSDGYYPVSFEDEKEDFLIEFALSANSGSLLNKEQKELLLKHLALIKEGLKPKKIEKTPIVQEILDNRDAERYRSLKYKDPSSLEYIREIPFPGSKMQKQFLRDLWQDILSKPVIHLKNLFSNRSYIEPTRTVGSEGYLTREGRLKVKTNLRKLYRYHIYTKNRVERENCPFWLYELQESLNILIVNLLVWRTNSIEPFKVQEN